MKYILSLFIALWSMAAWGQSGEFDPENPVNPGSNTWDATQGVLTMDDFQPNNLYHTIIKTINGEEVTGQITTLIVMGTVSANDVEIASMLENCIKLDLKNVSGMNTGEIFYLGQTSLTTLVLPADMSIIDAELLTGSTILKEIHLYAAAPPTQRGDWSQISGELTIRVPPETLPLYTANEMWNKYTLLPFANEVGSLTINLPSEASDGRYKNMTLEIVEKKSGAKLRYILSDRIAYTFNGLSVGAVYDIYLKNKSGEQLSKISDIEIKAVNTEVKFDSIKTLHNVALKVLTSEGEDVTQYVQITWTNAKQEFLAQGAQITSITTGTKLYYQIILEQALGIKFINPRLTEYTVSETENRPLFQLEPIAQVRINGAVKAERGMMLAGATISVSQKLNGKYSKSLTTRTESGGKFALQVYDDESTVAISMENYITQSISLEKFNGNKDLDTISLKPISGESIELKYVYIKSAKEGETPEVQNWYTDYENISYTLYNVTQDKPVSGFAVQYPAIILPESVVPGNQIRLTVTSRTNAFMPTDATVTAGSGKAVTATFNLLALGGIEVSYAETQNSAVVGMLYNSDGELIRKETYKKGKLSLTELQDGTYTLVTMGSSLFFNSILRINQLSEAGLEYAENTLTIQSGRIVTAQIEKVPTLDESKLYYTGNNTLFTANKASITIGNYLTLSGTIDFKPEYATSVTDVKLIVNLPKGCEFVEQSVLVGGHTSNYTFDETNQLKIALDDWQKQIKFCITPMENGTFNPSAYIEFNLAGNTIQQPIGAAKFQAKWFSISVPELSDGRLIPISGTATSNAAIEVYDTDILIGNTTALANGKWGTNCDLTEAYNLSEHNIHAKITTTEGKTMQTEAQIVTINRSAILPSTVSMSFYNGYLQKNIEVIFDLLHGTTSCESYQFYNKTPFTFIIDFTNNDPQIVSDVLLNVYTDQDEVIQLKAIHDKKTNHWVASQEFDSYKLPVNVSVDFNANIEARIDRKQINDTYERAQNADDPQLLQQCDSLVDLVNKQVNVEDAKEVDLKEIKRLQTSLEALLGQKTEEIADDPTISDEILLEEIGLWLEECKTDPLPFAVEKGSFNFQDAEGTYKLKNESVSNIDGPTLEKQGYTKQVTTDSTFIYVKSGEQYVYYIDPEANRTIKLDITLANAAVKKNATRGIDIDKLLIIKSTYDSMLFTAEGLKIDIDLLKQQMLHDLMARVSGTEKLVQKTYARLLLMDPSRPLYKFLYNRYCRLISTLATYRNTALKIVKIFGAFGNIVNVGLLINEIKGAHESISDWIALINTIENLKCPGMDKLALEAREYAAMTGNGYITSIGSQITLMGVGKKALATGIGAVLVLALTDLQIITDGATKISDIRWKGSIRNRIPGIKCEDPEDQKQPTQPERKLPTPDSKAILDPSGYVYEAVPSNRLEGVIATCYYKEFVEDMYGEQQERVVLWDAKAYAQQNPLFTDSRGMYAWDVPKGLWQVKFDKEGYQTTYSEWLPVPPPQLEVNIGMKQDVQPAVIAVRGFETGIEIDFSKYMLPATLTREQFLITCNGKAVNGEISLLNKETDEIATDESYASKVRFVPSEALAVTDNVVLTVSRRVKSYADVQMENDFSQEIKIQKEMKAIKVLSAIEVAYNRSTELLISVEPAEAAVGKISTAISASSIIASISPQAVLNEKGEAVLTINGELLGSTVINLQIDGMDLKAEVKVSVLEAVTGEVAMNYQLSKGWNWISFPVNDENMENAQKLFETIKPFVVTLKNQSGELLENDGGNEWTGTLRKLNGAQAYKIKMRANTVLDAKGSPFPASQNTITLQQGWNWIGYLSNIMQPIGQALQTLPAEKEDIIKGIDGFAVYDGNRWTGSLTHLLPGEGYQYLSSSLKSFNFPSEGEETYPETSTIEWSYNQNGSEETTIAIAQLFDGEQQAHAGQYLLGAFIGEECLGVAVERDGFLFFTIHGQKSDNTFKLRAYNVDTRQVYDIKESITWSDNIIGSTAAPIELHLGTLTDITIPKTDWLIYPNPAREKIYFRTGGVEITEIRITDAAGRLQLISKSSQLEAGLDISMLDEGIYFITLKIGTKVIKQKIIKIK